MTPKIGLLVHHVDTLDGALAKLGSFQDDIFSRPFLQPRIDDVLSAVH